MSQEILQTKNLTKNFKDFKAVKGIDLSIKKGRVYGFLGPNGAGKSTTIRMLLGLIKPTKGEVKIFGKDLRKNRMSILKKIGSMVEAPSYYGNLTAYENLQVTAELLELDHKYIDEVLKVVKLTEWKDRQASKFSLGMKQRLGIAQALISKPELLILDEPTNGLDPSGIHEIRGLIKELPKLYNMTVIISSHNLSEIELIADDIGIINRGKMLFQGTLEELHSKSKGQICIESKDLKKLEGTLNNSGYKYKVRDKDIFLEPEGRELDEILKQLILNGNRIFKFVEVQKSLEEIFLDLTEGGENI
ncbi:MULTISPECIES: ABC transporter ATP-binding protein [Clostridium]|uniref:ABC transporter ATP-binding protein YxlF n=3 Tax=Clostridium TaxID=1485 RepID=D8GSM7_CLOLD|nr:MULTISPECIES: ABC transporter ATP-binding protein [Clostridium]ADK14447.1 predicted ABC transporter, ATPase component [Clostridium ljungdahlii DSM 13528]AGY77665.1 ABC transporter ATP-binding protein [Clostridium autoethanogenum DSM 10061]ALU37804.1 putative ABC transporter [Clostridium autoethanogenum DSM 10061]OAA88132.1 putative ABC transporter ATP-binding protein YxlF [Clostridium ljungdahlii DSM 13528]OVY49845.1 putative ABC transporter ATP-binding protein YxlF [Clostridium autoethanog